MRFRTPRRRAATHARQPGALVSVAWLRKHLDDPDLRVVHVSSEPEHYPKGHIRGAVFADLHTELALRGRDRAIPGVELEYLIPDADVRRREAFNAGAWDPDDRVVFYDDWARNRQAIRGLWLLRLRGFPRDRVHVLDGGTKAWWAARLALTTDVPEPRSSNASRWDRRIRPPRHARAGGGLESGDRWRAGRSGSWTCARPRSSAGRTCRPGAAVTFPGR